MTSIHPYERRDYSQGVERRRGIRKIVGFLVLIVLTLGAVFVLYDLFTFPVIEAAPIVDDQYICANLEKYDIEGTEAEVLKYCAKYAD